MESVSKGGDCCSRGNVHILCCSRRRNPYAHSATCTKCIRMVLGFFCISFLLFQPICHSPANFSYCISCVCVLESVCERERHFVFCAQALCLYALAICLAKALQQSSDPWFFFFFHAFQCCLSPVFVSAASGACLGKTSCVTPHPLTIWFSIHCRQAHSRQPHRALAPLTFSNMARGLHR